MNKNLIFLKLGGSLITNKDQASTLRPDVLSRLAKEIASALQADPQLSVLVGHGSGSFGHVEAKKHGTRNGYTPHNNDANQPDYWKGFAQVYRQAHKLHTLVMDELHSAGILAISFPPSASVESSDHQITNWSTSNIVHALQAGLVPVIFGDVVFDRKIGGTIESTEELFSYLCTRLKPGRILIAGVEDGVWLDYPANTKLCTQISSANIEEVLPSLQGSRSTDVTGGMDTKVREMLALAHSSPGLQIIIYNGTQAGSTLAVMLGEQRGTTIC